MQRSLCNHAVCVAFADAWAIMLDDDARTHSAHTHRLTSQDQAQSRPCKVFCIESALPRQRWLSQLHCHSAVEQLLRNCQ